ncbi:hypothetical protein GQ42DRAFT_160259 [Ramicandelaber brevisporus]|nr:hypothetical protein GQ42DRAFT_160259 [Ramicandelaber brevisporus]
MSRSVKPARVATLLERAIAQKPVSSAPTSSIATNRWTLAEKLALARAVAANEHFAHNKNRVGDYWTIIRDQAGLSENRTAAACAVNWSHIRRHFANQDEDKAVETIVYGAHGIKWSKEDVAKLRALAEGYESTDQAPNWGKIAAQLPGRSPASCMVKWYVMKRTKAEKTAQRQAKDNNGETLRRYSTWKRDEADQLLSAINEWKRANPNAITVSWKEIMPRLDIDRTMPECAAWYHVYLRRKKTEVRDSPRGFTKEEAQRLRNVISDIQTKYYLPSTVTTKDLRGCWDEICTNFGGSRTKMQLYQWWYEHGNRSRETRLTAGEIERLKTIVAEHGNKWKQISEQYFPSITTRQLLAEYILATQTPWTQEETERLLKLVEEHGQDWKLISTHFTGKIPRRCQDQYQRRTKPR